MPKRGTHNEIILFQVVVVMAITFIIIYFSPSLFPSTGARDVNKIYESLNSALQKGMITIVVIGLFLFLQEHFGLVSV